MPIFEYRCEDCNSKYEILHFGKEKSEDVICPNCNSTKHKKLLSAFSPSVSSSNDFTPSCSDGSCGIPSYGGCSTGMCGLN
ncbi:MAG: zinc ribbon domain-containing protein [Ignavibacteria bacterium]|nr:zinc ribbon domain-containing protein [Ignavibacteria bacterium]